MFQITSISKEERDQLELMTRGQHENTLWMSERMKRITSTNFGPICKATARRDQVLLARNIVNPTSIKSRAMTHGRLYESVAIEKFEEIHQQTETCGLFICSKYPWLAASPDRVIPESNSVVEVKCPYVSRDRLISTATVPYLKSTPSGLMLDKKHNYYFQVQGQLLCANMDKCYFCVFTKKDFRVCVIERDQAFIDSMIEKLNNFFDKFFKDIISERYIYRYYDKYFMYGRHRLELCCLDTVSEIVGDITVLVTKLISTFQLHIFNSKHC